MRTCARNALFLLAVGLIPALTLSAQQSEGPPEAAVRAELATGESLLPKLADRAAGLYLLATDYATLGDFPKALSLLKESIELDEGFDPSQDPAFARMRTQPDFQKLLKRSAQHFPVVQRAKLAFTVPETDLIPEGLAADPSGHNFYLSSLNRRKIVLIRNQIASDFVKSEANSLLPVLGLKLDPRDASLWANTGADSTGQAELVHFDAEGKLLSRFGPPTGGKHLFNDLVLRGENEIYLTDSLANEVYRFDRKAQTFTALKFPRPLYYPNGIALSADGNVLFAADAFGVMLYNLRDGSAREVQPGKGTTLAGVDGMYWDRGWLVAVQNGIGLPRLARFQLSDDGTHVLRSEVIEYRSPFVELPTTGAIVQGKFYFICNSQLDNLRDEKIVDPKRLQPVRIGVVNLE